MDERKWAFADASFEVQPKYKPFLANVEIIEIVPGVGLGFKVDKMAKHPTFPFHGVQRSCRWSLAQRTGHTARAVP